MRNFVKVMRALPDSNRIKLIKLLQRSVLYVFQIQKATGLIRYPAGKHPKNREGAGLITFDGKWLWPNYCLAAGGRNPCVVSLLGNLRYWPEEDPKAEVLLARLPAIRGEIIAKADFFWPYYIVI